MRARTMVVADHHFDRLVEINEGFATWLYPLVKLCAVVHVLAKGVSRRSLLTSNPNEQLHSELEAGALEIGRLGLDCNISGMLIPMIYHQSSFAAEYSTNWHIM